MESREPISGSPSAVLEGNPASRENRVTEASAQLESSDQRRLRHAEALHIAEQLEAANLLPERIRIYNHYGKEKIYLAASLFPDRMPLCNGEFEFLELRKADHFD